MGLDLFEGCDGDDAVLSKLEINRDFARRLEHNKRREALHRLHDLKRRGLAGSSSDSSSDESSSSTSDDDDGADLARSRETDVRFYDALVKVKRRDPVLLRKDAKFFSSDEEEDGNEDAMDKPKGSKKEKPLYLKDVMGKHLIEEGPEFEDQPLKHNAKVYKKEQVDDIKAFLEAEKEAFKSDGEEDIIKEKEMATEEVEDEEDDNAGELHKKLDEYFGNDENLDENEMFLKNFFLNKMWVDKKKDKKVVLDDEIGVSEDEDELDKQDRFEAEYNFRHEEAGVMEGGDRVWGHSRVMEGSVRKKDSSRKTQRKSKEERMALAERERKEELKHMKNLKKKEIQEKLEKIRAIAGIRDDGACKLDEDDMEEDFDPEEYDKKMREMFGQGYYDAEDADAGFGSNDDGDLEKPDFDKEDELLRLPKDWDIGESQDGFAAARERFLKQKEEEEKEPRNEEGKRKRKRKISLREKVELEKELEEYYKLDYEDTIEDLKTRFKYKSVLANRYGLQTEEILMANDKDLNQYVSLKKIVPYRQDEWKVTYHQKLKKKIILQGEKWDGRKSNKKHKLKEDSSPTEQVNKPEAGELNLEDTDKMSKKSRRKRRQAELKLSRSRLLAYGKIPSKPTKKR